MSKVFSALCLTSALLTACGADSFSVATLVVLAGCAVFTGLSAWYSLVREEQQAAQRELNEKLRWRR